MGGGIIGTMMCSPPIQLEAYYAGEEPSSVAGDFGNHSLYKNLGYFSLIGLLRLHCQLRDYYQALQSVANVQLSKKVLATTRVPAGQISLYYYVGFCYLMMRRYTVGGGALSGWGTRGWWGTKGWGTRVGVAPRGGVPG